MAHSKEAHAKMNAMSNFNKGHWEKNAGETSVCDLKYASEMGNPEDLKKSVDALSNYVKKNQMKY